MIPSPNLDDRTYKDIRDEAIRLIPHYCPEWTNHNPTDPGITLIELFSWMTEMMIYRLNRVPDKMYLTLLDLVGLSLLPPQPAKVLLIFKPVEGYQGEVTVKKGTRISTSRTESAESVIFETTNDIKVTNNSLKAFICMNHGLITDNSAIIDKLDIKSDGITLFSGQDEINRHIYITDPSLAFLKDNNIWNLVFNNSGEIKTIQDEIVNFLEWEYWNGKKWIMLESYRSLPGVRKIDNQVYFKGPIDIEECEVEGIKNFFLRASLISIPEREECFEINHIGMRLLFYGEGVNPDICYCNTGNMIFNQIDLNKDFTPFIDIPKYNDAFYIASDEVFSKNGAEIMINFYLSDLEDLAKPEPNEDLVLKYEYWNGKNWITIHETTPDGVGKPKGEYAFTDTTHALTRSGEVKFKRPADFETIEINGQNKYWLRIRIGAGDFGTGGQYKHDDEGKWVWFYDKPVSPPALSHIRLRYTADHKPVKNCLVYNDFKYENFSDQNIKHYEEKTENAQNKISPFYKLLKINREKWPISYFGFDKKFSKGLNSIYFKINEKKSVKPVRHQHLRNLGIDLKNKKRPISLKWEYWNGSKWEQLSVNDFTDHFHQSGFIEFITPEDIQEKNEFNKSLCWLRLIFESGSFEIDPKIIAVHLNSVYAFNEQSYFNEMLGSSNGTPSQEFKLLHPTVLPGLELLVREKELPPANERDQIISEEGPDAVKIVKNEGGEEEYWIRYHEVDNFYTSRPYSRHYVINYEKGTISFGDGQRGVIPPRLSNNIKIVKYKTGGGSEGNVGANTITILRENIPYINSVNNYYSADGGADLEDLERLKSRATNIFKNFNRAVTAEDYEWLAKEASTSVGRAKCLSKVGKNGEVILIVIPEIDPGDFNLKEKIIPTFELLRRVKDFIDVRKMVGTKLRVEAPVYKTISIKIKLVFKKNIVEIQILKDRVELLIRRFFHSLKGGTQGNGWTFGMPMTRNDVFRALEKHDGISYIEEVTIVDDDLSAEVEKVVLPDDGLIHISRIDIIEREYQY